MSKEIINFLENTQRELLTHIREDLNLRNIDEVGLRKTWLYDTELKKYYKVSVIDIIKCCIDYIIIAIENIDDEE